MKVIALSGTPGTGKSTLAKLLEKEFKFYRLDLHEHYQKISSGYDRKKKAYDIDYNKFENLVKKLISEKKKSYPGLIIDTHISHHLPKQLVDICIILTCNDLKILRRRLVKRKYSKSKVEENLDAEKFQVCQVEALDQGHKVLTFDTSKGLEKEKIISQIKSELRT